MTRLGVLVDSGSEVHVTTNIQMLVPSTIMPCDTQLVGITGDNVPLLAKYKGSVRLVKKDMRSIELKNVVYCPEIQIGEERGTNGEELQLLVSVDSIKEELELDVFFCHKTNNTYLQKDNVNVVTMTKTQHHKTTSAAGKSKKSLALRKNEKQGDCKETVTGDDETVPHDSGTQIVKPTGTVKDMKDNDDTPQSLHARFHPGETKAVIDFLAEGFGVPVAKILKRVCDACAYGKAKLKPRPKKTRFFPSKPGQRLSFDIFVSPWICIGNTKYFLIVVDDYSGYVWGYQLQHKHEVYDKLANCIARINTLLSLQSTTCVWAQDNNSVLSVAGIRGDGAKENWSKKVSKFCDEHGITKYMSLPHSQYQNGIAERNGGIIWQGAQTFLHYAQMPEKYQFICMLAYIHIKNRVPSTSTHRMGRIYPSKRYMGSH